MNNETSVDNTSDQATGNHFLIDSEYLSPEALAIKHRLETDPSSRKSHMEYLPGMEIINSDIRSNVMDHMNSFDYSKYTGRDVMKALEHETCSIEDFKALLSPAAEPFLEQMAVRASRETSRHFGNTVYMFTPLYIANYCENYCVYCGFNCYNHINRMKLSTEQIEKEMKIIADSGMEEILILTGESRSQSDVTYIGEACRLARKYFRMVGLEIYPVNTDEYRYLHECGADYVTVFQYLVFTFLPGILGIGLAGTEFMWPKVSMNLFGVKFTWSLLGYNVLRDATGNILIGGGLGYFISYELGSFLAQCINFPLQRNITFKSHGNPVYQAIWYFVAWVVISLICNGFNNLWMPVAAAYVAPAVYNMLVTIITGGVSMVIFFFVFKIIFPEGKAE